MGIGEHNAPLTIAEIDALLGHFADPATSWTEKVVALRALRQLRAALERLAVLEATLAATQEALMALRDESMRLTECLALSRDIRMMDIDAAARVQGLRDENARLSETLGRIRAAWAIGEQIDLAMSDWIAQQKGLVNE